MKTSIRTTAFLLLAVFRLEGGILEDSADALGSESFQQREQAEAELKKAGPAALKLLQSLIDSDDPEIVLRAKRIRDWIICGIDARMPADLAADLPGFDSLSVERQDAIIKGLAGLSPPHLAGLANLHTRLSAMPLAAERRDALLVNVALAIRNTHPPKALAQFTQWPLDVKTRALLVNLAASGQASEDLKETYATWQKEQPELRNHLDATGVNTEVERLRTGWDKKAALSYVGTIRDDQAFQVLVREFCEWMLGDPSIKFEELGDTEAIAYLELAFESASPGDALPLFRKLRDRIPDLGSKLRPSREAPLRAFRLWGEGKQAEAAGLLCGDGNPVRNGVDFLARLMLDTPEVDFAAITEKISGQSAATLIEHALRKPVSDLGLGHALKLSSRLRAKGFAGRLPALSDEAGKTLALDLWKDNRDELSYRVMEEAFWAADGSDEWRLSLFPALASARGRIDEALETAKGIPSDARHLELRMAYLNRAAGKTAGALEFSAKTPDSAIHKLLLLESRNWRELAEMTKRDRHLADWFACLNGEREEWRGHVPEPEKKSAYLRLMLDDHASLFSEALEDGGAGVSDVLYAKVLAGDSLLERLLCQAVDKAIDEGKPIPWEDFGCLFEYPDRITDRQALARLIRRLAELPDERLEADPAKEEPGGRRQALAVFAKKLGQKPASPARSQNGKPPAFEIISPKIGDHGDPRTDDFAVLDGLAEAGRLFDGGDPEAAGKLAVRIVIRLTLDERLRNQPTGVTTKGGGMFSSGSGHAADLLMLGCIARNAPREISLPMANILSLLCLDPRTTYITKSNLSSNARVLSMHGEHERACQVYHRFFMAGARDGFHYTNIQETAYLAEFEIRRALAAGDNSEAVQIYGRHHRLIPYDTRITDDILRTLRATKDEASARKLNLIVTGFWEDKLKGLPDSVPYRKAFATWNAAYGKP